MSRILGFVIGALLVFGGLYYLLSPAPMTPETTEVQDTQSQIGPSVAGPQPEPGPAAETSTPPEPASAAEESPPSETPPASPQPSAPAEPSPVRLADQPTRQAPAADIADELALVEQAIGVMQTRLSDATQPEPVTPLAPPEAAGQRNDVAAADDTQWFAVWDPFHSELSANAFARRLERMTGLDYRVVRSGPAHYEVAVAFRTEQERVANIAVIEEATGLRIAGGSL